jgi:hypothetical protein
MLRLLRRSELFIFSSILIMAVLVPVAKGWDNTTTHQDLSKVGTQKADLNKGYLINTLGIQGGINEILHWNSGTDGTEKSILQWIQDGANFEDKGPYGIFSTRPLRHFHNPLSQYTPDQWITAPAPYDHAGLDDYVLLFHVTGESAVLWAQDGENQRAYDGEDWSWQNTRTHYSTALTAQTKPIRDAELAQTFVGIGHVIHLLQDMSQPSHVRDDAHLEDAYGSIGNWRYFERLENWAKVNNITALNYMNQPPTVFPNVSTANSVGSGLAPITAFWDTDNYTGNSPVSQTEANTGLAEYTNSNYFSDNTLNPFVSWHIFPFPSHNIADYVLCEGAPPERFAPKRYYVGRKTKPCNADGTPQDHFAAYSLMNFQTNQPDLRFFMLDDHVYQDYAQDLLPRAVAYSSALIDYFFRGKLGLEVVGTNQFRMWNHSSEPLNDGTVLVYYDNANDDRILLGFGNIYNAVASGQSTDTFSFEPPPGVSYPPTDNKTPGVYWVVFLGTLGGEDNAVIGSVTGWKEEWDHGLTGNHNWYVTPDDHPYTVPGGVTTDLVENGALRMFNYRPAGTLSPDPANPVYVSPGTLYTGAQVNEQAIGLQIDLNDPQRHDMFPITLGEHTGIFFKVNAMTSSFPNPTPNLQGCDRYRGTGILDFYLNSRWRAAWQVITFSLDNGGTNYVIDLTVPGQERQNAVTGQFPNAYAYVIPGVDMQFNPYQFMQNLGVPIVPPLTLENIHLWQQLWGLCNTSTTDDSQSMAIDYIRIREFPP